MSLKRKVIGKLPKEGIDGKSAYEIAVEKGFVGTEEEWLESLHGADGKDGINGKDGKDGVDGVPGPSGPMGPQGPQGPKGENGKDGGVVDQLQSDWNQTNTKAKDYIKNKPTIPDVSGKADAASLQAEITRATTAEENLRQLYNNLQQSQPIPVTALPATGEAGKIYRLAGTTSYADYMYSEDDLTTPIKMAEYNNAIDDEPTAGSNNLVKGGGVYNYAESQQHTITIIGKNNTFASREVKVIKDKKYRLYVLNNNWARDSVNPGYTGELFSIYENDTPLYVVYSNWHDNAQVRNYIDFTVSTDTIRLGLRANNGVTVYFCLVPLFQIDDVVYPIEDLLGTSISPFFNGSNKNNLTKQMSGITLKAGKKYLIKIKSKGNAYLYSSTGTDLVQVCINDGETTIISVPVSYSGTEINAVKNFTSDTDAELELFDRCTYNSIFYLEVIDSDALSYSLHNSFNIIATKELFFNPGSKYYFIGSDNTYVSRKIYGFIKNHKYRVYLDNNWDYSNVTATNVYLFNIAAYKNGVENILCGTVLSTNTPSFYDFVVPECDYISIGGRANYGTTVYFTVEDITAVNDETSVQELSLMGEGTTTWAGQPIGVTLKAGQKYIFGFECKDIQTDVIDSNLEILQLTGPDGNPTYLGNVHNTDSSVRRCSNIFIPDNDAQLWLFTKLKKTCEVRVFVYGETALSDKVLELLNRLNTTIFSRNEYKYAAVRSVGYEGSNDTIKPLAFIHMSDLHTKANEYKRFQSACMFLQKFDNIKFAIVTGDIVYDDYRNTMDYYNIGLQSTSKPVLNVVGNHDAGQYHSDIGLASVATDEQVYQRFIAPYENNWGIISTGKPYYYKDFTAEKIRVIVLYEFETDYELDPNDSTKLKYNREGRAFRQSQIDWFINALNNTPNDYGVILATHYFDRLDNSNNDFVSDYLRGQDCGYLIYQDNSEWILKVIDAFQNKRSLNLSFNQSGGVVTTLNVNCDFSNKESTEFICCICGHTHNDFIGHFYNYPNISVIIVGSDNLIYTGRYCRRVEGEISEDLFNIVNVDRNDKRIDVIRIGANYSIKGQVRDKISLNY